MLRPRPRFACVGDAQALVTAPVQKSVISEAGFAFSGHTEFLAELTGAPRPVMLLAGTRLRVALATTHLPLRAVPDALDAAAARALDPRSRTPICAALRDRPPAHPRARPESARRRERHARHRGADDHRARRCGELAAAASTIDGPAAGRHRVHTRSLARCDAVLAMYHDQGLPVLKALSFGEIVNVTLGLPIVRTSVDHGTALTLAGTGRARPDSLFAAIELALELAERAQCARRSGSGSTSCTIRRSSARIVAAIEPRTDDAMVEIGARPRRAHRAAARAVSTGCTWSRSTASSPRRCRTASPHPERLAVHRPTRCASTSRALAPGPRSLRIVGNLPYNISTPLLFHLLELRRRASATCTSCCNAKSSSA